VNKAQLIIAVGAGYLLGRTRKLRWALALAGVGASRKLPGNAKELTAQGARMLGSSPETKELAQTAWGRLTEAGRAAAMAALSSRLEDLNDRLHERTDLLLAETEPEEGADGPPDEEPRDEEPRAEGPRRARGDRRDAAKERDREEGPAEEASAARDAGTRPLRRRRGTVEDAAEDAAELVTDRPVRGRRTGGLAGRVAGSRTRRRAE